MCIILAGCLVLIPRNITLICIITFILIPEIREKNACLNNLRNPSHPHFMGKWWSHRMQKLGCWVWNFFLQNPWILWEYQKLRFPPIAWKEKHTYGGRIWKMLETLLNIIWFGMNLRCPLGRNTCFNITMMARKNSFMNSRWVN